MGDVSKRLQAITMLAQELHISMEEAEEYLEKQIIYSDQVKRSQLEAAAMVNEMID